MNPTNSVSRYEPKYTDLRVKFYKFFLILIVLCGMVWRIVVRASDLQPIGRRFESRPIRYDDVYIYIYLRSIRGTTAFCIVVRRVALSRVHCHLENDFAPFGNVSVCGKP